MPAFDPSPPGRDHRSANADKKRGETRARILGAALALCVGRRGTPPTVEDVVVRAKVSRGTFYKYFDSIEAALSALGHDLTRLSALEGERFRGVFTEKWKSTAVALRALLTRAHLDPLWTDLALRTRGWRGDRFFADIVLQDLAEGRARGEYQVPDDQAAFDVLCGLIDSCADALHRGVPDPERYIDAVVRTWLQALGVEPRLCAMGVDMSRQFLSDYVSGELQPFLTPGGEPLDG